MNNNLHVLDGILEPVAVISLEELGGRCCIVGGLDNEYSHALGCTMEALKGWPGKRAATVELNDVNVHHTCTFPKSQHLLYYRLGTLCTGFNGHRGLTF